VTEITAWALAAYRILKPVLSECAIGHDHGVGGRLVQGFGSRILVLLTVEKSPFAQVNYGTGRDVSDESIADAKEPLQVRWYNDSRINIPISSP
jgi:hypothetical protein